MLRCKLRGDLGSLFLSGLNLSSGLGDCCQPLVARCGSCQNGCGLWKPTPKKKGVDAPATARRVVTAASASHSSVLLSSASAAHAGCASTVVPLTSVRFSLKKICASGLT